MAAHVVNRRQLRNALIVEGQRSATESAPSSRQVIGRDTSEPLQERSQNDMRAKTLAGLPSYDQIAPDFGGDKEAMREGKREQIRQSPRTSADMEARGILDPIKIGLKDPFDYMRGRGHSNLADCPMQVMNGNHRVTWALDNHPSMWVPIQRIGRKRAGSMGVQGVVGHGEGPSFQ